MNQEHRRPERTPGHSSLLFPSDQTDKELSTQTIMPNKLLQKASRTVESFVEWQTRLWFDTRYVEIGSTLR